jgi:threonine dehydrogenase-like Zn-dependent dehydrogenase
MRSGQTPVQRYWKDLLEKVRRGELDPSVVITHHYPLSEASKGYQIFNDKQDNVIKIVLKPGLSSIQPGPSANVLGKQT